MKKPRGKGGQKEPHSDDHEVWLQTTASIEPLKRGKPRVHPAAVAKSDAPGAKKTEPKPTAAVAHAPGSHRNLTANVTRTPPPAPAPIPPPLATFDRKTVRKIRIGRAEIEARVDLHGMHQHEAHTALRAFLLRSHRNGLRFVLVITGKGKPSGGHDAEAGEFPRERGVLKRNVPRWLEEPELRSIVVSFTTAAIHHGGEGALYIHLRAKDRT